MARLDATSVWFQRGEDETAMAETPSTGDDEKRGLPRILWIVFAVAVTAALFCGVVLHLAHASKMLEAPLANPPAAATAPAAAPQTQLPALQIQRAAPATPALTPAAPASTAVTPASTAVTPAAPAITQPKRVSVRPSPDTIAGEKLLRHGRAAAALPRFQQVLARDNDDVRALRGACLSLAKLGRSNDAARVCRRALDRAPEDLETRRALATIYYNGGAYKWSAAEWRQVVAKAPHDARARKALRAAQARSDRG
jgi:tetratricopeptide (TPR) repeat protein